MQIVQYVADDDAAFGFLEDGRIWPLSRSPFDGPLERTRSPITGEGVVLLPPTRASKVVAVSSNFHKVLEELGKEPPQEPLLFIKPETSIVAHLGAIVVGGGSEFVTHEPELAIVIAKECKGIAEGDVADYVLGYTCANDVSSRDIQNQEVHMTRAKGFDTYCPLGPVLTVGMPRDDLDIRSYVNDELVLDTNMSDMIFSVPTLVSFISRCMTLRAGDVISTGAGGVGPIIAGDVVDIEIEDVGRLSNPVVAG